jgi:two-component system sensor histidine kinase PhcS
LGLSVSYAIIQRHGATLRVASEWGAGTEFSFDLALASPQP